MDSLNRRNDFIVTLPSNASMKIFPSNKPSDYKTKLATTIDLEGAGGDWEVALVDVQLPHSWYNFTNKALVVAAIEPNDKTKLKDDNLTQLPVDFREETTVKEFLQILNTTTQRSYFVAKLVIEPGYFDAPETLANQIATELNEAFKKKLGTKDSILWFERKALGRQFFLKTTEVSLRFYTNAKYLMDTLGFGNPTKVYKHGADEAARDLLFEYVACTGGGSNASIFDLDKRGGFDRDFSVYVYSDLVRYQLVGDAMAPLLGVVPVEPKSKPDTLLYWGFNPPYYLPLRMSRFDTIQIALCADTGKELEFRREDDKVTCRLHFRCRNSI